MNNKELKIIEQRIKKWVNASIQKYGVALSFHKLTKRIERLKE